MVQVLDLADAIRPAYICSKILPICPYTIRGRGGSRKLVFLKRDIIIVILQLIVVCHVCYNLVSMIPIYEPGFVVDSIALVFQIMAHDIGMCTNMLIFHVYRKDIAAILSEADEIDTLLNTIGCSMNYNTVYKHIFIYLLTELLIQFTFFCFNIYWMVPYSLFINFIYLCINNLPIFIGIITRNILNSFLYDVKLKYSLINGKLQTVIHTKQPTNQHISTIEDDESLLVDDEQLKRRNRELATLLHRIVNIHGKLNIHCDKINYVFHLNLLLHISACFAAVVAAGYILVTSKNFRISFLLTYWTVYNIIVIIYMVYNFNVVRSEAMRTNQLMSNFRYSNLCTDDISALVSVHILRLKHQQLTFTACGLFPIDNTLLFAMTAGVATYIAILYQFKINENE